MPSYDCSPQTLFVSLWPLIRIRSQKASIVAFQDIRAVRQFNGQGFPTCFEVFRVLELALCAFVSKVYLGLRVHVNVGLRAYFRN